MNNQEFDEILNFRIESIKSILTSKAKEYAHGDRLYNFKRAAEIERATPAKSLFGMLTKHLVSVIDMVEGNLETPPAMVNEKIGDLINYLILLEAVFKEKTINPKCVACGECSNSEIN
jgi:hypothetical protein